MSWDWTSLLFVVALLGIPVVMMTFATWKTWSPNLRRWWWRRKGLCPSCGYDRRGLATPTDKCPECGSGA